MYRLFGCELAGLIAELQEYKRALVNLGVAPSIHYKLRKVLNRWTKRTQPFVLYSNWSKFPLKCRPYTSDVNVFHQIFISREYRCLDDIPEAGLIVDCGANVGYSAAYFLSKFPKAYLIAVEPDKDNFELLNSNLAPYSGRYQTICSAVWSHRADLVFSEEAFRDGKHWSRTVRESRQDETPAVVATDIGSLLIDSGYSRISILKVDIEGSESVVFAKNFESWISKVDNLVIELHGDECRSVFSKAIANESFEVTECEELTVCKRSS